tara:strand:- start:227 stop:475 length:249 start_codon:yes stop_codon:yes gene_type:complete
MEDWIYDLVEEALYYEVYTNPDNRQGEYDWVTDRVFQEAVEECSQFLKRLRGSDELPESDPDWRDEENAHLSVLEWMGSYFV